LISIVFESKQVIKMKPKAIFPLIIVVFLLFCAVGLAEVKEIISEGTYNMGDGETPTVAESRALLNAKRVAVEKAGTYVESYSKVKNFQLTADEIRVMSSGVMEVSVLDKTRTVVGDGFRFWVKIKALVSSDKMDQMASKLKDKAVIEDYKRIQDADDNSQKEIEALKKQLLIAKDSKEKEQVEVKIRQDEKTFTANQFLEKGYTNFYSQIYDKAIENFTSAINVNPTFAEAYIGRGRAYTFGKINHDKAIDDFTAALRIKPDILVEAYYNRGMAYAHKGQYDMAIADFNRCLKINPKAWGVLTQRAAAYEESGQIDKAIQEYTRIIKADPRNNILIYRNRASAYKKAHRYNEALKDYSKLIDKYPDDWSSLLQRGALYSEMGRENENIKDLSRGIQINPASYMYISRGAAYEKAGKKNLAIADYRKACDMGDKLSCHHLQTLTSDWVYYGNNAFGDNYYNKLKIKYYANNLVRVWGKQSYSVEGRKQHLNTLIKKGLPENDLLKKGYDRLEYTNTLYEINCKNKTLKLCSLIYYSEGGLVIEQIDYENLLGDLVGHSHISPESAGELLFDKVCSKEKK
jgi:tetratricopeptide (TPR) repeat protein